MVARAASRAEEYKNRVLELEHAGILRLWGALCRGTRLRGWPPGRALEYLLLRAFQLEGAEVTWPYHAPILKLKAQLSQRPRVTMGAVFSMSGFSQPVTSLVRMLPPADVLLWRGAEIERALQRRWLCKGMKMKLRYAKEHGLADMDLIEKGVLT